MPAWVSPGADIYQLNKTSMKTFSDIQYDFIAVSKNPQKKDMKYSGLLFARYFVMDT